MSPPQRIRWMAMLATSVAFGCSDAATTQGAPLAGDAVFDAGNDGDGDSGAVDAGVQDAGKPDTGSPDTGPVDSGPPDAGPAPIACHPVNPAKGPCPAGEHCVWSNSVLVCEKDGAHGAGEECDDGGGCKVGICVKGDSDKSHCAPHCIIDLDCASGKCNGLEGTKGKVCDVGEPPPPQCNPLVQKCSGVSQACYSVSGGFTCKAAGSVKIGSPCPEDNSCVPGAICVGKSTSAGVCRKVCNQDTGFEPFCDVGVKCTPYQGSTNVGYCEE